MLDNLHHLPLRRIQLLLSSLILELLLLLGWERFQLLIILELLSAFLLEHLIFLLLVILFDLLLLDTLSSVGSSLLGSLRDLHLWDLVEDLEDSLQNLQGTLLLLIGLSNLHSDSHEHWVLDIDFLISHMQFQFSFLTMSLQHISDALVDDLVSDLLTLSHHNQMVTLQEFFLLFLVAWSFWCWQMVSSHLTKHGLEVLMHVHSSLHLVLGANIELTLYRWLSIIICTLEPDWDIESKRVINLIQTLIDKLREQALSLLKI